MLTATKFTIVCSATNVMSRLNQGACRFEVELRDARTTLKVICLGGNAEKLFPITAGQLKEKTNEAGITDPAYLTSIATTTSQILLLKPYEKQGTDKGQRALTIISIEKENSKVNLSKALKVQPHNSVLK